MKTIFIDLNILPETKKDLLGFLLTQGYNFRKVEFISQLQKSQSVVIEAGNKREEKALNAFLKQAKVSISLMVENSGKAGLKGKKLGVFTELSGNVEVSHYLDKSTGKKFAIC
jgi:hypothetical protein